MESSQPLLSFGPDFVAPTVVAGSAFVKFTPVAGVHTENGPFCFLLEVDNTKILLDVGITASLTTEHLKALQHVRLDAVLLTHSGLAHTGGLPFLMALKGEQPPVVYATTPVHHLASVALYEAVQGFAATSHLPPHFEPPAIESALARITQLRYSQPIALPGGIIVVALPSGHTPGGTIWRIRKSGEDIFHVLRMNHRREATLDGAPLQLIHRPSLLLMDAVPALRPEAPAVKDRNAALFEAAQACTKHGGNVLIPIDYDRLIELLYSLKQLGLGIVVCGFQVASFLDIAQSLLEWMGASLMKEFEKTHANPFRFDSLTLINTFQDLDRLLPSLTSKIIITCGSCAEYGFTQRLLLKFLPEKGNLVLFPQDSTFQNSPKVELQVYEKEYLEGEDLRRWRQSKQEEEQQAAAEAAFVALQKRRSKITDELAELAADEEEEEEAEEQAEDNKEIEEDIQSAQMLRQVYWSDYRNDWHLDVQKDAAMRAWITDPEAASLSMLGGVTPGCRYQVFPVASGVVSAKLYPQKLSYSPYGLVLDYASLYSTASSTPSKTVVINTSPTNTSNSRAPVIPKDDRPHRFLRKSVTVSVRCQRKLIDFSGLTDGKSLRIFLAKMAARRTILLGASTEATDYLFNHLQLALPGQEDSVVAPRKLLECVNVTQSQLLVPAVISDELALTCRVAHLHGYELGKLAFLFEKETLIPPSPSTEVSISKGMLMMIGDLKLPLIKRVLSGIETALSFEFVAGDLHVFTADQRRIAIIRKSDEGCISVEGEAGPEFILIRKLLYQQLAIIQY